MRILGHKKPFAHDKSVWFKRRNSQKPIFKRVVLRKVYVNSIQKIGFFDLLIWISFFLLSTF
jgi:hypothetical protein